MKTIKITELAKKLNINHSAISLWNKKKKIPAGRIFEVAKIIKVSPISLNKNNDLLFNMINSTPKKDNITRVQSQDNHNTKVI